MKKNYTITLNVKDADNAFIGAIYRLLNRLALDYPDNIEYKTEDE